MADGVPVTATTGDGDARFAGAIAVLRRGVGEKVFPGAAAAVGTTAGAAWIAGVGRLDHAGGSPAAPGTIYDLASLTKVVATTSVVLRLVETGRMRIDAPVREHLPEFAGGGRDAVTVEHLLTHSSGLPAWRPLFRESRSPAEALALVLGTSLQDPPGSVERYSDLGAILLGECAVRAGGWPLATLAWREVLEPLAMRDTGYRPPASEMGRIAPTEIDGELRKRLIHGEVHDENAWALGGIAGHAGLFSTAEDLARFAVEMLRAVRGVGRPGLFGAETARLFTTRRGTVPGSSRALGWDTRADGEDGSGPRDSRSTSGRRFSPGSFGHTGFTGTSIWIDPVRDRFAVLLANAVHPTRKGPGMLRTRRDFHDAVAEALDGDGRSPGPSG
jgi:CubicO group peptidase (beta-lactamase class C family)